MKICKLLFCLALGTMLFSGCRKETPATPLPDEAAYVGRLDVIEIGDALFRIDDLRASFGWIRRAAWISPCTMCPSLPRCP